MTSRPPPTVYAHPGEHLADCLAALLWRLQERAGRGTFERAEVAEREALRHAREEATRAAFGPLPLDRLAALCGLSPFDVDALLAVLGAHLRPEMGALFAELQGRADLRAPSPELLATLLATPEQRAQALLRFAPGAPLMAWGLVAFAGSEPQRTTRALSLPLLTDVQVLGWLLGTEALDPREQPWERLPAADPAWAGAFGAALDALIRRLREAGPVGATFVQLRGPDAVEAEQAARALADRAGLRLFALDAQLLLAWAHQSEGRLRGQLRLLEREVRFFGGALLVREADCLHERSAAPALERHACVRALLDRGGLTLLHADEGALNAAFTGAHAHWLELDLRDGAITRRAQCWERLLGGDAESLPEALRPEALAASHPLSLAQVEAVAQTARGLARARPDGEATLTHGDLSIALERHTRRELGAFAREITAHYRWEDLILPPDSVAQLHELCSQVRQRHTVLERWGFRERLQTGLGVHALFCGPPGTGKTMAAALVARELGLALHKIDLSTVVSKYIGETEKHLGQLFREAAAGNVVLFFDEAESLFSRRTQVEDSHDRYANLETGFLLQQIEAYPGVTLLATNLSDNLDSAFLRRLGFVIDFPFPGPRDRLRILQTLLPPRTPRADDLDLEYLAERFHFAGGNLRNVVLHAAYSAAREHAPLSMKHLLRAARRELLKLGRPFVSADYPEYRAVFEAGV
ncbi:MAG: AAA family ATPase [Myxococcaceae bacterium]|nr:AAA family ATPase [Myxococcaceae bacterium]